MNPERNISGISINTSIQKVLQDQKISVHSIHVQNDYIKDINIASEIKNIVICCEKSENGMAEHLNLFAKLGKTDEAFRESYAINQMYKREVYTYKQVLPEFSTLQKKKKVRHLFKSYPKFYTSVEEEFNEFIILENLSDKGFEIMNKVTMFDCNHALLVVKELVRFHALSFALKQHSPQIFKDIVNNITDIEYHGKCEGPLHTLIQTFFPCFITALRSGNYIYASEKLKQIEESFFEITKKCTEPNASEPYSVVNHGDLWLKNILFKYNEFSKPTEICLIDFQFTRICSPVSDLSQLIFSCISKETRKKHCKHLINEYYKSLSLFLKELGCDVKKLFPYHVLKDHLKRFSIIGLASALKVTTITSVCCKNNINFNTDCYTVIKTLFHADKDIHLFNENIQSLVLDYIKYGYDL